MVGQHATPRTERTLLALPRPPELEAVLLDAGNTLVFLDHAAIADVARGLGVNLAARSLADSEALAKRSYERFLTDGGSHTEGWSVFMRELLRTGGAPENQLDELVRAARKAHDDFNLWRRVPEGSLKALTRLRAAKLRLGVVSNSEGALLGLLERVGLAHLLEVVVDSAIEGVRKPDPEIFRRTLARLGVPPARALYVGDIPEVDVDGALAAGVAAVLIDPLGHYPAFPASHRVTSLAQLGDLLL